MKFLGDRCVGRLVATWLETQGHEVLAAWDTGPDPGDAALLQRAATEDRVLVTIQAVIFSDHQHRMTRVHT